MANELIFHVWYLRPNQDMWPE